MLCIAMGEESYDVSALPRDQYPPVSWDAINPADELERLADFYGGRLVYHPEMDGPLVAKLGDGAELPIPRPGEDAGKSVTLDPPEPPSVIACYGSPKQFQCRLRLEAVGSISIRAIKPVDELSYKPAGGWGT